MSCHCCLAPNPLGNCEEMCDGEGHILTNHTVGDVWAFVIAPGVTSLRSGGGLNNIAATVLELLGLEKPEEMDGGLIIQETPCAE